MTEELKSCPFCGSKEIELRESTCSYDLSYVTCLSCHAQTASFSPLFTKKDSNESARAAWNERV